ncbi:hypothetical protein L6164_030709 [Bauhinia variegata]|uniref:Uncharacterized protein n=1 Tax=Bauhinia variegata TaxID=167791 RepID=A0ACB9LD93_BAUVA|nr:hypothetical protein L6164_030709 [Bauhinia variegata]
MGGWYEAQLVYGMVVRPDLMASGGTVSYKTANLSTGYGFRVFRFIIVVVFNSRASFVELSTPRNGYDLEG